MKGRVSDANLWRVEYICGAAKFLLDLQNSNPWIQRFPGPLSGDWDETTTIHSGIWSLNRPFNINASRQAAGLYPKQLHNSLALRTLPLPCKVGMWKKCKCKLIFCTKKEKKVNICTLLLQKHTSWSTIWKFFRTAALHYCTYAFFWCNSWRPTHLITCCSGSQASPF